MSCEIVKQTASDTVRYLRATGLIDRCALTVVFIGLWGVSTLAAGYPILNSLSEKFATLKPVTGVAFVAAGMALLYDNHGKLRYLARMLCVFIIASMWSSMLVPFRPTFEINTVGKFTPSLVSMFALTLFSLCLLGNGRLSNSARRSVSYILMLIATMAIAGYALNCPPLYGDIEGISTGVSIITAIGFLTLGFGLRERGIHYERGDR